MIRVMTQSRSVLSWLGTIFAVMCLVACSGPEKPRPADLGPNTQLMGVKSVWSLSVGAVEFPLEPKVHGDQVLVAGSEGTVLLIDAKTGAEVWRIALKTKLSAGVGFDGRYAAVVAADNTLIALDAGKELWRQKLAALTLTAPLVAGGRVFVNSADRTISAFDGTSGRKLWQQERRGDALVLQQSGVLLAVGDTLVIGAGGNLIGLQPSNGNALWNGAIASSRGTNDVERLVDLVAGVSREGNQLCVRAFQAAIGCVDATKGSVLWSKPAVGSTGISGDATTVYGTEADGKLVAWRREDGERLWVSERLRHRVLSAPLLLGRSIVVGESDGTVHFLSRVDASPLNRVSTDGSAIVTAPIVAGQTLVVVTQRGGIFGFRPE